MVYIEFINRFTAMFMGCGRRMQGGALHPLEFENDDVRCCFQTKYSKILLAHPTLAVNTVKLDKQTSKSSLEISLFVFGAQNIMNDF